MNPDPSTATTAAAPNNVTFVDDVISNVNAATHMRAATQMSMSRCTVTVVSRYAPSIPSVVAAFTRTASAANDRTAVSADCAAELTSANATKYSAN